MKRRGNIFIGTSGWNYPHWKGPFYPADIKDKEMLAYYCGRFGTVEVNNTFYRLPTERSVERWRETAPAGFVFAVKASRFITHIKRLRDAGDSARMFLERVSALGEKLGPVLFQLPPGFKADAALLREFLAALPEGYRYTFEFRNETWHDEAVYAALAEHGAAFCIADFAQKFSPLAVTADFVYARLHGPAGAYAGQYDDAFLSGWARNVAAWSGEGRDVYCYFDNDMLGFAAEDAARLVRFVGSLREGERAA